MTDDKKAQDYLSDNKPVVEQPSSGPSKDSEGKKIEPLGNIDADMLHQLSNPSNANR